MTEVVGALRDPGHRMGLSFGRFMELALYGDPGYYTHAVGIGGAGRDFYTAAQSPLFAAALCNAIVQRWEAWGRPSHLQVVELGAGQGELAATLGRLVANRLSGEHVTYAIVERSAPLQRVQQRRCASAQMPSKLTYTWQSPQADVASVVIANEVLDALPVERLRKVDDHWLAAWVVQRAGADAVLQWRPAAPDLAQLATQWLPIPKGTQGELCTGYELFFHALRAYGQPLCAWFIDYGINGDEWAAGMRPNGTLRGYRLHQVTEVLSAPGEQDLTADVNWDHARAAAQAAGMHVAGLQTQGNFLVEHGIVAAFSEWADANGVAPGSIRHATVSGQLKQLILPGGMGERYQVMQCELEAVDLRQHGKK